jgi:hypothetical protein
MICDFENDRHGISVSIFYLEWIILALTLILRYYASTMEVTLEGAPRWRKRKM